jgi:hypothetical protein
MTKSRYPFFQGTDTHGPELQEELEETQRGAGGREWIRDAAKSR